MRQIIRMTGIAILLSGCGGAYEPPAETVAEIAPGGVRLEAPDCPNWHDAGHFANYGNAPIPNFGCAHAHNLAQVIEKPEDFLNGKSDVQADALRSTGVLEIYRQPPPAQALAPGGTDSGDSTAGGV